MKKLFTSAVLFLLFTSIIFGKNNDYKGFIITKNNDTIRGFIDYKNWDINPKGIKFKKNANDKATYYPAGSIAQFNTEGEIYVSAIVKIEQSPYKINELTLSPELVFKTDTVFLRAVIISDKGLYYLKDKMGKESYYIKQGNDYVWLIYSKYLRKNKQGKQQLAVNNKYIGQLILYFKDCKNLNQTLSNTTYTLSSLTKAFERYNNCTNSKVIYQPKKEKVKLNFSVLAGVSFTKLKFKGDNNAEKYFTDVNYPMSTNFTGGVALEIVIPRNFGRWSLNNELLYSSYSTSGSYKEVTHEDRYIITDVKFAFTYLKLNNMLRYSFPIRNAVLFADLGFSNGFMLSNTNRKIKTNVLFDQVDVTESAAIDDLRKHEQSLFIGIGIKYKKFSGEVRYETGNGFTSYNYIWSSTNRYFVLLSYIF